MGSSIEGQLDREENIRRISEAKGASEERAAILAKMEELEDKSIGGYPEKAAYVSGWNAALNAIEFFILKRGQG